ncbi:MAG TPA: pesticidal protein Cry15Aa, partial [Chloroflexaceae bacterium]|nr:pesticidal protein Cry15Aa [Chloroflexaceae bacterium]
SSIGGQEGLEAEIARRIDHLVATGALGADESARWRELLLNSDFGPGPEHELAAGVGEVPSRNDVVRLHSQVDDLVKIVDQLLNQQRS